MATERDEAAAATVSRGKEVGIFSVDQAHSPVSDVGQHQLGQGKVRGPHVRQL